MLFPIFLLPLLFLKKKISRVRVDAFILSTSTDPLGTAGHIPSSLKFMIFVGDVDK